MQRMDHGITVNCMEYKENSWNLFRLPTNADENGYTYKQVISCIVGVSTKNERKKIYSVTDIEWRINCMEYVENSQSLFRWPTNADENDHTYEKVISCIVGVSTKNERRNVYSVTDVEWRRAFEFFNRH